MKEDFESAKEEIRSLQREISRLKHSYREEAMTPRTEVRADSINRCNS